jgi:hypothetical protein
MSLLKRISTIFSSGEEECQPRILGRNDDCWCGSGKKYKKCHLEDDGKKLRSQRTTTCGKT